MTPEIEAAARLRAWIRDYGDQKQPAFIADLEAVLAALSPPELTLPNREGWWWEWEAKHREWRMRRTFNWGHKPGMYWTDTFDNFDCRPGRWVQCVPPPQ